MSKTRCRKSPRSRKRALQRDIYAEVTERILVALAEDTIPWRRPWSICPATPRNWEGRSYHGTNWLLLSMLPFEVPVYVTFRKALALGGRVGKGEKGHRVILWRQIVAEDDQNQTFRVNSTRTPLKVIPVLKTFTVFNVRQCDNLPDHASMPVEREFEPIDEAERIVETMKKRPSITEDGRGRAYYSPTDDSIHLPKRTTFDDAQYWYGTLFHELAHATGHSSRLDRGRLSKTLTARQSYAREELVAELGAAFLCAYLGIDSVPLGNNQASYIATWHESLTNDPKAFVWAAGRAAKAAEFIAPSLAASESRQSDDDLDWSVEVRPLPCSRSGSGSYGIVRFIIINP